jgi:N-acyl-D-aspartate/D-glutamate deacylase
LVLDLLIKGGTVVDGTGLPRFQADLAIKDGLIVEVGRIRDSARRVVDAGGLVVAPGIVDAHTHYDAQITWDPLATSSCFHGVTTVVAGNCGYTLAPCRPEDRDWLAKTFAAVEGVDLPALEAGLDWRWETYPEYLDRLEGRLGVNFTNYVGHSAVRRYVLGEEAHQRAATPDEIEHMRRLVREAMAAGAAGFSTSGHPGQVGYNQEPIPSRLATDEELLALAAVVAEFNVGSLAVLARSVLEGVNAADRALLVRLARETGRPVMVQGGLLPEAAREGVAIYSFMPAQPMDQRFTLRRTPIFNGLPTWREVLALPHEERLVRLRTDAVRDLMRHEADHPNTDPTKGEVHPPIPWQDIFVRKAVRSEHAAQEGKSMAELATLEGKHVADAMLDLALAEDLETEFRLLRAWDAEGEARVRENLASPYALVGTSDGGAHLNRDDGADFSTYFLRHWALDRPLFSLEEAIRQLTFLPACAVGLSGRGLLRPGYAADVIVFDPANLRPAGKETVRSLPGGGLRFVARSAGVLLTIVNGEVLVEEGEPTGALPGRVLRHFLGAAGARAAGGR